MNTPHAASRLIRTATGLGLLWLVSTTSIAASPAGVVDDAALARRFVDGLAAVIAENADATLSSEQAARQLTTAAGNQAHLPLAETLCTLQPDQSLYEAVTPAIVVVGSIYKCGNCADWHLGGMASGWILSADGLVVTNHHVLGESASHRFGVMTADGTVYPISRVVAADEAGDAVIVRIDTRGSRLPSLMLGTPADCGDDVTVISHPAGRFYSLTTGVVSRYHRQPPEPTKSTPDQPAGQTIRPVWMSITADYAVGSSGGPVFDEAGRVVGMVSRTYSSQAGRNHRRQGTLGEQMVFKDCVSLDTLQGLIRPAP
jgi:serine protease Do